MASPSKANKSRVSMRRRASRQAASGAMPLMEHLRELRRRLLWSAVAIVIVAGVAWSFYSPLFTILREPLITALARSQRKDVTLAMAGVAEPFTLQLQVVAVAGVIGAAPVWLFHLWRFVTPGLHAKERRRVWGFLAAAVPLFLTGVWVAFRVMPQALGLLIGFTPAGVANIIPVATYISFIARMIAVFGFAFLVPVFVVALNLAGVVRARTMLSWWRQILIATLVFAAVATPTGDPINMLILAVPMYTITLLAIAVRVLAERKRHTEEPLWDDDEVSELPGA
ncbi:MAG: twin-arginine translocase subunit TatC [Actinobacteria bacterium]|nr:twin-arginine translocase subunit TatC [Actinomycetota bacterium]